MIFCFNKLCLYLVFEIKLFIVLIYVDFKDGVNLKKNIFIFDVIMIFLCWFDYKFFIVKIKELCYIFEVFFFSIILLIFFNYVIIVS